MEVILGVVVAIVAVIAFVAFVVFVIWLYVTFFKPRKTPEPDFTHFTVTPSVCLNLNPPLPLVTVEYGVNPDGWSNPNTLNVKLTANAGSNPVSLHSSAVHQYFSENLPKSGSLTFNVDTFFGQTPPTSFTVTGTLAPAIAGNSYATRNAQVSVLTNCSEPGLTT